MVFIEEKDDKTFISSWSESDLAIRRQDKILQTINEISYRLYSYQDITELRNYLTALKRLFMELSVVFSKDWKEEEKEIKIGNKIQKVKVWVKPKKMLFIENTINSINNKIESILTNGKVSEKENSIFNELDFLEQFLRRLKQIQGMGIKQEENISDEERLAEAFGVSGISIANSDNDISEPSVNENKKE